VIDRKPALKWLKTLSYVIAFIILLVAGGHFLLPLKSIGVILWMLLAFIGLFLLVRWHARCFSYRCTDCGHIFHVSPLKDFFSLQGVTRGGWKYLKCPQCRKKIKAQVISEEKENS
jgi:DNA-directed RNA polymerase subunit RPC12/RpoP